MSKKKKEEEKKINDSNKISFPRGNSLFSVSFSIDPRASFRLSWNEIFYQAYPEEGAVYR